MRQHIPTTPRDGRTHGCGRGNETDIELMWMPCSLVLPIGVFGMLQVPKRTAAADFRNGREIIMRRRRTYTPFERPSIPRITACELPSKIRPRKVTDENQNPQSLEKSADRDEEIPGIPAATRLVGINPARHSKNSGNVHQRKSHMKADDEKPEV